MKQKISKRIILALFTIIFAMQIFVTVKAETVNPGKTLDITLSHYDPESDDRYYGYSVNDKKVWKIVEKENGVINWDKNQNFYCIKAGPGFNSQDMGDITEEEKAIRDYVEWFDLKDKASIQNTQFFSKLPQDSASYNSLLWILDNGYVRPVQNCTATEESEAEDYRIELLMKAFAGRVSSFDQIKLKKNDIEFVQQLAIWHFTNSGNLDYDIGDVNTLPAIGMVDVESWDVISIRETIAGQPRFENGDERQQQAGILYKYLIEEADRNKTGYVPNPNINENANLNQDPIVIDKNLNVGINGENSNNYIIGPYRITKEVDWNYNAEVKFKDGAGATIQNVRYVDSNGTPKNKTIDTLIQDGEIFYISIPKATNIDKITLEISGTYYQTTTQYWSVQESEITDNQPVALIDRKKVTFGDMLETEPEIQEPQFDLALRKYITKIISAEGVERTPSNRTPVINTAPLTDGNSETTTAEYKHKKTKVPVKYNETVIYTISVYNEGEIEGKVTRVVDYLPEGLQLKTGSSINEEYGWEPNGIVNGYTKIVSNKQSNLLKAFDPTKPLDSDIYQVECVVTANPGPNDNPVELKNVAEITGAIDKDAKVLVAKINGSGINVITDIDSDPNNVFEDGKHTENSVINGYTPGEQDDDDFEKLEVRPETPQLRFDLALKKFITKVNGQNVQPGREPSYDATPLTQGALDADYTLATDPVLVKTGDRVTYVIRVYNEGEIDGKATLISDYLPSGLEFIEQSLSATNREYGWTLAEDQDAEGYTRIVTNYLADKDPIPAFDKNGNPPELKYADVEVECRVVASPEDTAINLRNIAEIAEDDNGNDDDSDPGNIGPNVPGYPGGIEDDDDYEDLIIEPTPPVIKDFDLALRKFVTSVDGKTLEVSREPVVDASPLVSGKGTTAIYNHPKTPVSISIGKEVIYTIRVYNEGEVDGYVTEITDYLPQYLEFVNDEFNAKYGWQIIENGRVVKTDITSPNTENSASRDELYKDRGEDVCLLKKFNKNGLDYIDVQIKCKVKENAKLDKKITNIAAITGAMDVDGNIVVPKTNPNGIQDIDSTPTKPNIPNDETLPTYMDEFIAAGLRYIPGQQDDDDFEKLALNRFDLALRKFITSVNGTEITNRIPKYNKETNTYEHPKDPVLVEVGDIVTYTIRVYNEGNQAGYAAEVMDNIPEGLEYLPTNATNLKYGWKMYKKVGEEYIEVDNVEEAQYIKTTYLSKEDGENANPARDNLIPGFNPETMNAPAFKDVKVAFKVKPVEEGMGREYINIAEISDDSDENGDPVGDDDSTPGNGDPNEDDIDKEVVYVKIFDLALRKFITAVGDTQITNRVPVITVNENGTIIYEHPKDPVEVGIGDIVTYTIRVYNEGEADGYAEEITDNIPNGLIFLPDNAINVEYGWKMYKADGTETDKVEEAVTIKTRYLSKEAGEDNLIPAFDPETMDAPAYKDVKVTFKVAESAEDDTDRVYVNIAEISDDSDSDGDPGNDNDSTPGNGDPGEDDIDEEVVKVIYFDLALKKWVSLVTTIVDGKTTVIKTGHTGEENPEPPVKLEVKENELDRIVIKYTYIIKVTNEGEIPGYATEITEYIPQGLKFVAADNPDWKEENGKVITTKLENTLLNPGESTTVEIILTWINGKENFGEKVNVAEISKDKNDRNTPDRDSTPNNQVPTEDDIDRAPVVLTIKTGVEPTYIILATAVLVIISTGIILIKRYLI